mmetsp:Transcript_55606/g.129668  ORF Transcript_55606/g.129668 Transcript_55606/m.129668 type:complete len:207 (-) Transcript_55606:293-913(-)
MPPARRYTRAATGTADSIKCAAHWTLPENRRCPSRLAPLGMDPPGECRPHPRSREVSSSRRWAAGAWRRRSGSDPACPQQRWSSPRGSFPGSRRCLPHTRGPMVNRPAQPAGRKWRRRNTTMLKGATPWSAGILRWLSAIPVSTRYGRRRHPAAPPAWTCCIGRLAAPSWRSLGSSAIPRRQTAVSQSVGCRGAARHPDPGCASNV